MSAGSFVTSRYAASYGAGDQIHPIRIQPETLALSLTVGGTPVLNNPPVGALTNPISARVSASKRSLGLSAYTISFRFTATPPTGYAVNQRLTLPILNQTLRSQITKGTLGEYLGVAIEVTGTSPEKAQ